MPEPERSSYGGTRVDQMLGEEDLAHLIEQVRPAPRMTRGSRILGQISTEALKAELERREGLENAGE